MGQVSLYLSTLTLFMCVCVCALCAQYATNCVLQWPKPRHYLLLKSTFMFDKSTMGPEFDSKMLLMSMIYGVYGLRVADAKYL